MSRRPPRTVSPLAIVRRGIELSPEFRPVIGLLVASGLLIGLGRIAIPVLFQQLLDDDVPAAAPPWTPTWTHAWTHAWTPTSTK